MNIGKVMRLVYVLAFLVPSGASAEDGESLLNSLFREPIFSSTPSGFFNQRIDMVHAGMMEYGGPDVFFVDLNWKWIEDTNTFPLLLGGMIPASDNFAIPLFFEYVTNDSSGYTLDMAPDKGDDFTMSGSAIMLGGGLVFHGSFGVLGAYAAYKWEESHEYYYWSSEARGKSYEKHPTDNRFQWAFFPLINAKEYPYLSSVVSLINGFFSFDALKMGEDEWKPSYKANVLFRDISFGFEKYLTLGVYTIKDWYSFDAKYSLYAAKADYTWHDDGRSHGFSTGWLLSLEGGIREFFDVERNPENYENGVYTKFSVKRFWQIGYSPNAFGLSFYLESGSKAFLGNWKVGVMFSYLLKDAFYGLPISGQTKLGFKQGFQVAENFDLFVPREGWW